MSEPTNQLDIYHSPPDRSFLAVGGWAIGLLVVVALFFRFAASGTTTNAAPPPAIIAVAPDPAEKAPTVNRTVASAPLGEEGDVTQVVRGEGRVSTKGVKTFGDLKQLRVTGRVVNGTDQTVESCRVAVTFVNADKKTLASESAEIRTRLAPGASKDFKIGRDFLPGCRGSIVAVQDVKFANSPLSQ